ncbi:methylthioribose kinase [Weizmannia coagulans]|nr:MULTISPECIES: hypothetical protein [Heyndrickxia]NWN95714.1 methylthioribose kinase [Bacillus sp. (in: firmicutes)]AEO99414.1 hypothetical protein Bcoa_0189 [Heyndrickxia coagulans 36D1]AJO23524.1 hypothetical protein SB48_HM08orf04349 [Heyndrickxia coagulans]AKN54976.1 hypothetical protein AB434_2571 [Heyndrickxia coagulans]APB35767.1 methylthioribose kinase [Heyndrickxia coagulans]
MQQRFIELGNGYTDLFELIELAKANRHRLHGMLALHTIVADQAVTSPVLILKPTDPGEFQALYVCLEGIPDPRVQPNKRYSLFAETAAALGADIVELEVRPSSSFSDKNLFYQYLIGILRMNRLIPPLQ